MTSELSAQAGPPSEGDGYIEQELLLSIGALGQVHGRLLLPAGSGAPWPAVLVLPGHEETAEEHRDARGGAELARRGLAALILDTRAYDGRGGAEHDASLALLCAGHSLLAIRVIEALSALDVLGADPRICRGRIGVLGHSGGGGVARLVGWLSPDVAALVVATQSTYSTILERYEAGVLQGDRMLTDDYDPDVAGLASAVDQFELLDLPVRVDPYDGPGEPSEQARTPPDGQHDTIGWLLRSLGGGSTPPPEAAP